MRVTPWIIVALLAAPPALAQGQTPPPPSPANPPPPSAQQQPGPAANQQFACSQIPDAQRFLDHLRPGPNTRAAQRHLDAAKHAANDQQCIRELHQVDYYARRSQAIDQRLASEHVPAPQPPVQHVQCADALHQDRPGGSDYHGPPVAGCPKVM